MSEEFTEYRNCRLCPRKCGIDRTEKAGICRTGAVPAVNLYMVHRGEEPPVSGSRGSGAVFFEGCPLHCIFCQNSIISKGPTSMGIPCDTGRLVEIFYELRDLGVHNINLVTALHFAPHIASAISKAREQGFDLPFVINCSGYESAETVKMLDGLADIWLPDFKYWDSKLAAQLCHAPDYREVTVSAIDEMFRQVGKADIDPSTGLMRKGMIVRHLMLPSKLFDTKKILDHLTQRYGNDIYISLMNQYTPMPHIKNAPPDLPFLLRKVPKGHYEAACDYLADKGQYNAFVQEEDASGDILIPKFRS